MKLVGPRISLVPPGQSYGVEIFWVYVQGEWQLLTGEWQLSIGDLAISRTLIMCLLHGIYFNKRISTFKFRWKVKRGRNSLDHLASRLHLNSENETDQPGMNLWFVLLDIFCHALFTVIGSMNNCRAWWSGPTTTELSVEKSRLSSCCRCRPRCWRQSRANTRTRSVARREEGLDAAPPA